MSSQHLLPTLLYSRCDHSLPGPLTLTARTYFVTVNCEHFIYSFVLFTMIEASKYYLELYLIDLAHIHIVVSLVCKINPHFTCASKVTLSNIRKRLVKR